VEKFVKPTHPNAHSPIELDNIVFMGTNVVSGTATAVAVETGSRTYFGALAQRWRLLIAPLQPFRLA